MTYYQGISAMSVSTISQVDFLRDNMTFQWHGVIIPMSSWRQNCRYDTVDRISPMNGGQHPNVLKTEAGLSGGSAHGAGSLCKHCKFLNAYPNATVVASAKAFTMMGQFFGNDFADRRMVVSEKSTLELGKHTLTFVTAPMVHWPEVIVTYDSADKVLFSADGFGKFGALDVEENWACEARRYYFGIVGKYGPQVPPF